MKQILFGCVCGCALCLGFGGIGIAGEADLKDGISEYTDDAIEADDKLGEKDTNINYVITAAIAKAKASQYQATKALNKGLRANFDDGSSDQNQNSVVVGAGSKVDTIINIVEQK